MPQTESDTPTAAEFERSNALMAKALGSCESKCRDLRLKLAAAKDGLYYASRQLRVAQRHREAERVEEFLEAAKSALEKRE